MTSRKKIIRQNALVEDLSEALKRDMFSLFEKYYDYVDFDRFLTDLNEKTHVFFFYEQGTKRLVGFSTIFRKEIPEIASGLFLFSGDTVIHEDYWGSKALQKSFFWFILESKIVSIRRPVYWMLMSKGVKTYLMMRKNFPASYPNYREKTPKEFKRVQNAFYQLKFPKHFKAESGLIVFEEKAGSVKTDSHFKPKEKTEDPEANFFYQKNPGFENGEELACICEIRFVDFSFHLKKFFLPKPFKK